MSKAVVLLSGGLDSACCLHMLRAEAHCLFARYGQPHQEAEEQAARALAAYYHSELTLVDLPQLGGFSGDMGAASVVPNRNMILVAVAANLAVSIGACLVVIGANATDHEHYPDCRPAFLRTLGEAVRQSCGVHVEAPFRGLAKSDLRLFAATLGVPVELTWSCYRGGEVQCGECGACTA